MEYYISIDLGATKTRIALCTRNEIIEKTSYPTPRTGDENTIPRKIIEVVKDNWSQYLGEIRAIGVASIGPLDLTRGMVVNTPNIPIHTFELLRPLVREFKKPVYIANDCVASAWGERLYGDARDVDNLIYLTLSTGIGAGIVVDGNLLIGKMGNAHEVGHIVIDFNSDLPCGCGGRGHWEAFAGGSNIPRVVRYIAGREDIRSELRSIVDSGIEIDAKTLFDYYRRGDILARRVVELYIKATAAGIASIINTYDPELVIIGGSVFLNNIDILYGPIVELSKLNVVTRFPEIKPTRLGDDVGLYGGLAIAVNTPNRLLEIQRPLIDRALSE